MIQFEVGKTYTARALGDHTVIYRFMIVHRTAKTVTIKDHYHTKRRSLRVRDGVERCLPSGNHAYAPVIWADRRNEPKETDHADQQ